jgi:hypothetical protein
VCSKSPAMEAFVQSTAEVLQGAEVVGRFHGGSFCYRQLREATSCRCFVPAQLTHKLRLSRFYLGTAPHEGQCHDTGTPRYQD